MWGNVRKTFLLRCGDSALCACRHIRRAQSSLGIVSRRVFRVRCGSMRRSCTRRPSALGSVGLRPVRLSLLCPWPSSPITRNGTLYILPYPQTQIAPKAHHPFFPPPNPDGPRLQGEGSPPVPKACEARLRNGRGALAGGTERPFCYNVGLKIPRTKKAGPHDQSCLFRCRWNAA